MDRLQRWLNKSEAEFLELKVKENAKGRTQNRYRITEDQFNEVLRLRATPNKRKFVETIKKLDKNGKVISSTEKLQSKPIEVPDNFEVIKVSTSKTTGQQWIQYGPKKVEKGEVEEHNYFKVRDSLIEEMRSYAPKYPKVKYKESKESHCLVFDPADIHIGKIASSFETGEDYNSQIAVSRVMNGLEGILNKAKGFNFDKVIFVAGNDILHVDSPGNTTTSGTRQDVDGMWYDAFLMAKKLLVDVIELLMQVAPVEVVFNPSNHDFMSGFMLLDSVSSWFHKSEDVTFDCDMSHRKYTKYYDNLICTTHMDGAKMDLLPVLVAQESKMWDSTTRRYVYGHHVHHKIAKDYPGITLETLRSPSAADSWHHRNGYQHSPVAVEAFIHHKKEGQICRITENF